MEAQSSKPNASAGLSHAPKQYHKVGENLSAERMAKVAAAKAQVDGGTGQDDARRYDSMTYRKAQFAMLYGWAALEAYNNNEMTYNTFLDYLQAGLDIQEAQEIRRAQDMANAYAATQDEKAADKFNRTMKRRSEHANPDFSDEMEDL